MFPKGNINDKSKTKNTNYNNDTKINMPQFFDLGSSFKILNPYNFQDAIKRLQSLTDQELMNDLSSFTKKDFDFQNYDQNVEEKIDGLKIVTSLKGDDGKDIFIELVNISKDYIFLDDKDGDEPHTIQFNSTDSSQDITIKCNVDFHKITERIFKDFLEKSEFKSAMKLIKEVDPTKKCIITFEMKKNSINQVQYTSNQFLIELLYPPSYKSNIFETILSEKGKEKIKNIEMLFPFRIFNNEIANLKFKHFYFLIKMNPPQTPGNSKYIELPRNDANILARLKDMLESRETNKKIFQVNENVLNVKTEDEIRNKMEIKNELSDYFDYEKIGNSLLRENIKKQGFINVAHPNENLSDIELIKMQYLILAIISEGLLSYYNASKFVDNVFSKINIYRETIFASCPNEDFPILFNETLTKLIDIYQNRGEEFSLVEFEERLKMLYNGIYSDYQAKGITYISKPSRNKTLLRIQRIAITPTYIIFTPYILDEGNRILRNFIESPYLSIICVFKMDDYSEGRWGSTPLIEFIKFVLHQGIKLGVKAFRFFNFSQSQFRNMSCWLLTSPEKILPMTGDYSKIKIVAKYGARISQTLTTTRNTILIKRESIKFIDDVVVNDDRGNIKYTFSDGVGKISYDLAERISEMIHLNKVPSAFQGRFLGCKGVWTTMFDDHSTSIYIRPSQNKFSVSLSDEQYFELCDYSRYIQAYLNRQIIILLSSLKIPDSIFLCKLGDYRKSLEDEKFVLSLIHYEEWNTLFNQMYNHGVNMTNDRLIKSIVDSNKELLYNDLKSKARIYIKESAYVIGIMDEYDILEQGEAFLHIVKRDLDIILDKKSTVAKCPCLHPGDIRKLHFRKYIKGDKDTEKYKIFERYENVIIFPQKGTRPHPNELSGSDLDGDNYFVFYDSDLIPASVVEPMNYNMESKTSIVKEPITIKHVIEYFAEYTSLNNLGLIGDAHIAIADKEGANEPRAIKLAIKFSKAVDAPKTGESVTLSDDEHPTSYPHFMNKTTRKIHKSDKILGQVYDKIEVYLNELSKKSNTLAHFYDVELKVGKWESYAFEALLFYKEYYDEMLKMLKKNEIKSESVLLTGNNIDGNDATVFSKKKHNYDMRERVTNQMIDLFKRGMKKFTNGMHAIFSKDQLGNELNNEGKFKNNYHNLASACYIVSYDFPNIITNERLIETYKEKFIDEVNETIEKNEEINDLCEISTYECESLGFESDSMMKLENTAYDVKESKKEKVILYANKLGKTLESFFKECNKHFEIKHKVEDEENQYRILSFPWCFAGKILNTMKYLSKNTIKMY